MSNRDWDKELAMIDRQLASISDEQLAGPAPAADARPAKGAAASVPSRPPSRQASEARPVAIPTGPATPAVGGVTAAAPWRSRLALNGKLLVALASAVGIAFWPYGWRCGSELAVYLAAVAGVTFLGVWAARATWRHRAGKRHALALLVVAWGLGLAAWQALPRTGYALPTLDRPSVWACQ